MAVWLLRGNARKPPSTSSRKKRIQIQKLICLLLHQASVSPDAHGKRLQEGIRSHRKIANSAGQFGRDTIFVSAGVISRIECLEYEHGATPLLSIQIDAAINLGNNGGPAIMNNKVVGVEEIAVKRLSRNSGEGDVEFKNEVLLVAKLQHRNLVRLIGFCLEGNERLLIYEFVPNTSLNHYIFDPMNRAHLNWKRRYKIIGGIARGLLYLHEDSRLQICFQVQINSYASPLRIPSKFVKHLPKELPDRASLSGPYGDHWHVKLCKNENGICVQDGWQKFFRDHSLGNEFTVFKYNGDLCFDVQIFSKNKCKRVYVSTIRTCGMAKSFTSEFTSRSACRIIMWRKGSQWWSS